MQIHLTGRNLEITPALKTFTTEKMNRILDRFNTITQMNVTLIVEHLSHIAEATVHISGADVHASATSEDMYSAIDMLVDKLLTQVTKHKEKLTDHR